MILTRKKIVYPLVLLLYVVILLALPLNYFTILIIVPFIATGWALLALISFLKNLNAFRADIASDAEIDWEDSGEYIVTWEEEPRDIEWKYHTVICILWTLYYFLSIIIGLIIR